MKENYSTTRPPTPQNLETAYPYTWIEKSLFKSKAWFSLSGISPQIYSVFLLKRKFEKRGKKGNHWYDCTNRRELIFPYREAEKTYGVTQPRFCRAIDDLIQHGFLDIVEPGIPALRVPTTYGLSDRWKEYGTDKFKGRVREPGMHVGFCKV